MRGLGALPASQSGSSATLSQLSQTATHQPIAAATIFSRSTAPLSFPELDRYLSGLPAPSFPAYSRLYLTHQGEPPAMFPPMQLLAASGESLNDLENNSKVPQWWQSRNRIFGTITSLVLSITVRDYTIILHGLRTHESAGFECFDLNL